MKLISTLVAAAIAAVSVLPAQAVTTTTAGFNVTATLTSKCEITAAPTAMAFSYTSFQTTAATATGGAFSVRCTNTLPYTMAVDTVNSNTIIGLVYTLPLSATGGTGTGLAISHSVNGSMASGQSGTCTASPTATCTGTNAHTLTVSY